MGLALMMLLAKVDKSLTLKDLLAGKKTSWVDVKKYFQNAGEVHDAMKSL